MMKLLDIREIMRIVGLVGYSLLIVQFFVCGSLFRLYRGLFLEEIRRMDHE